MKNMGNTDFVEPLAETLETHAPEGLSWTYAPMPGQVHATIDRASKPTILKALFPPEGA